MPRPRKKPLPALETSSEPIGFRLAKIRKSRGLTQMQVAEQIGISQYLISDYETGRLHLSDEMLIRFATVLAASSDAILGIDGSHVNPPSLKLVRRLEKIERLPSAKEKVLLQTIDGFLKGSGV